MVRCCSQDLSNARYRITLLCALSLNLAACGGSAGTAPVPVSRLAAPTINTQPTNQSVPMGLAATFSVTASGASVQYQWYRDGAAISGANSSTFTTAATTFSDSGAIFSVSVSNAGGAVTSGDASLTVTARAPAAGDLRFQQVDAPYVVNGWGNAGGLSSAVPGRGAFSYSPSVGTPLFAGSGGDCTVPPVTNGTGCDWFYAQWYLTSSEGPAMGYGGDSYENFSADLQPGSVGLVGSGAITPASSASVINSLDMEPASDLFAVSWVQASSGTASQGQSVQPSGFVMVENTLASSQLQAAATEEGAAGRVITAISVNGSEVTYLAYGWQADTTTLYDSMVVTASTSDAPTAASTLAAQGYVITAIGQADGTGDLFLVGTRVQGDTMPRPFQAVQGSSQLHTLQQQGYAVVGVVVNLTEPADPYTWLGER
jgi:hypothetical protein